MNDKIPDPHGFYVDGFGDGNEGPFDSVDLDGMVWPDRVPPGPPPMPMQEGEEWEAYEARRQEAAAAYEHAEYRRSRSLTIDPECAQGVPLFPERNYGKE